MLSKEDFINKTLDDIMRCNLCGRMIDSSTFYSVYGGDKFCCIYCTMQLINYIPQHTRRFNKWNIAWKVIDIILVVLLIILIVLMLKFGV